MFGIGVKRYDHSFLYEADERETVHSRVELMKERPFIHTWS